MCYKNSLIKTTSTVVIFGLALIVGVHGRSPVQNPSPAFEVASIKPVAPGSYPPGLPGGMVTQPGGRFIATNVTVSGLIAYAFRSADRNLLPSQIVGGPSWITSSSFNITATSGGDISREELNAKLPALVRSLLEERFKLKAHTEKRMMPEYALVKARSDGRLGPELHVTATDCDAYARERRDNPRTATPASPPPPCGWVGLRPGSFSGKGIPMRQFIGSVSNAVGRAVVDGTDLAGLFDLELRWAPDTLGAGTQADPPPAAATSSNAVSIFTALQEQLGLKLESRQGPRDVVVIDHVEAPTPN